MTNSLKRISFSFDNFDESKCVVKPSSFKHSTTKTTPKQTSNSNSNSKSNSNTKPSIRKETLKTLIAKEIWEPNDANFRRVARISNIPKEYQNYRSLYEIFEKFGTIEKIQIQQARDEYRNTNKETELGRARILFSTMESAQICAAIMNETELLDRTLQIFIGQPPSILSISRQEREKIRAQRKLQRMQEKKERQERKRQRYQIQKQRATMLSHSIMPGVPMTGAPPPPRPPYPGSFNVPHVPHAPPVPHKPPRPHGPGYVQHPQPYYAGPMAGHMAGHGGFDDGYNGYDEYGGDYDDGYGGYSTGYTGYGQGRNYYGPARGSNNYMRR